MAELSKILEELSGLTVMEVAELSKMLEEKWGVTAAAPAVAVADAGEVVEDTKDSFDVTLSGVGGNKISVIKEVRALTGLGLKEAKGMVDNVPSVLKKDVPTAEAEEIKTKLEATGATVELA